MRTLCLIVGVCYGAYSEVCKQVLSDVQHGYRKLSDTSFAEFTKEASDIIETSSFQNAKGVMITVSKTPTA